MVTEIEYTRALNSKGWAFIARKISFPVVLCLAVFAYGKHCDLHYKERAKTFYNRSKMFGGLKNPQY